MKKYQVVNAAFQSVPVPPFDTVDEAERHIRSLQETYEGAFYVIELNIVRVFPQQRSG
jgi:hypothetical protein